MKQVVLIGSGNVATSPAHALASTRQLAQIYSRNIAHAQSLAHAVGCDNAIDDLQQLLPAADAYIIAVRDDAIGQVAHDAPDNGALWVHTSGSVPLDVLRDCRQRCGVLYPMQSFSRQLVTPLHDVHFFTEACNDETLQQVDALASTLTTHVVHATSDQRRQLHVAAVFSCNFANHLWTMASEVLDDAGLPFDAMLPLIRTTVAKLDNLSPAASQTGPAMRHDTRVIASHLAMLSGDKRQVYDLLSTSIMNRNPEK